MKAVRKDELADAMDDYERALGAYLAERQPEAKRRLRLKVHQAGVRYDAVREQSPAAGKADGDAGSAKENSRRGRGADEQYECKRCGRVMTMHGAGPAPEGWTEWEWSRANERAIKTGKCPACDYEGIHLAGQLHRELGATNPVRQHVRVELAGIIANLQDRQELILVDRDYEVEALKDHFGNDPQLDEFDGFLVEIEDGDYTRVYGFRGTVPRLGKDVWKVAEMGTTNPIRRHIKVEPAGLIADLQGRQELTLVNDSYEVKAIKDIFGDDPELDGFDGFFVGIEDGDLTEVYGFIGIVPVLDKEVWRVVESFVEEKR